MRQLVGVLCLSMFALTSHASTLLNISYSSNDQLHHATATLNAIDNGGGIFTAISGSGLYDGYEITLIPNPSAPTAVISSTGYFIYDDLVLAAQNPKVTNPGLLFTINSSGATEFNLFSEGPSVYRAYLNNGDYNYGSLDVSRQFETLGVTAAPEPIQLPLILAALGAILLIRNLAVKRRRDRKSKEAPGSPERP